MEILKDTQLKNKKNKSFDTRVLKDNLVGLYFSASWSPPCQQFTTLLSQVHEELMKRSAPFQIVYVPFDKTVEDMKQYYHNAHGDWLSIDFDDEVIT